MRELDRLKEDIEKVRSQFYIFYELTKMMRTTLRLDEIVYIILTGLTAGQGLGFNRAALFLVDEQTNLIKGSMGIGPINAKEAAGIWSHIEEEEKDLYALIKNYHRIKEGGAKPKFMEVVQNLSFPLTKESGIIYDALYEIGHLHITQETLGKFRDDPLVEKLDLNEFLVASVWIRNHPAGLILVDNFFTGKKITDEDTRIFNMFVDQAAGAIENSQKYEDTLTKAHTDALTSLWNYGYFQYRLDEELAQAKAKNYPISLLMIDIDDFKKFNDRRGHIQGDNALRMISTIIRENCRRIDIACRYGGEEFSAILPYTPKEEAHTLAQRIRKSVKRNPILNEHFTVSIGVASFPQDAPDKETFISKSDQALYLAKGAGKDKVILI
ncbi:MAG: sensor domain-containing diguanylate cyclase [Candidatus Omnitrophota bacterium]|nr:MAG: sensor domain-containing diguanylate cyclase [Candidatus Omnitrophota bacterium]